MFPFPLTRPIVGLSPMADYTDTPFTLVCKRVGGLSYAFREMVSATAIARQNPKTLRMAEIEDEERPLIQQIFGSDPAIMAEAARIIAERFRPEWIDINMGCPAKKIVSNFDGASLIRDPERAAAIVRAVKAAVPHLVLSVKTRLGWDDDRICLDFVPMLEAAGADMVTLHARTKKQGYAGTVNWDRVGEVAERVKIPVLVNGDITCGESAVDAVRRGHAAGCLIGRGALGNPWIFREVEAALAGHPAPSAPELSERINAALLHARLQAERLGDRGIIGVRKHLPLYLKGYSGMKDVRSKLVRASSLKEVESIFEEVALIAN